MRHRGTVTWFTVTTLLLVLGFGLAPVTNNDSAFGGSGLTAESAVPVSSVQDVKALAPLSNSNASSGFVIDFSNRPYHVYKDPDASWLTVRATLSNPLSAAGTVTAPNGTVFPMSKVTNMNGTVELKLTLGRGSAPGTYTVFVNVTKLPATSFTRFTVTENLLEQTSTFLGLNLH